MGTYPHNEEFARDTVLEICLGKHRARACITFMTRASFSLNHGVLKESSFLSSTVQGRVVINVSMIDVA